MRARPTTRSFIIISLAAMLITLTGCSSNNANWIADYGCSKTWTGSTSLTWRDLVNNTLPPQTSSRAISAHDRLTAWTAWEDALRQANHYAGPITDSLPAISFITIPTLCPAAPTAKP